MENDDLQLEAIWEEFDVLSRELGIDVRFFIRTQRHQASQCWRRAYCRALSAYFEAMTSWMARYTILFHHPGMLGDEERQTLEARLSALERSFHAFDLFTNTAGAESPLQRKLPEWTVLGNMIRIRNRILHPKRSQDVIVTDDDLSAIQRAADVIQYLFSDALRRSGRALLKRVNEAQKVYEQKNKESAA